VAPSADAIKSSSPRDSYRLESDSPRRWSGNLRVAEALALDSPAESRVMRAANLSSSVIARIAYDEDASILSIWFRETGRYVYFDVPRAIYDALKTAPSAGRFFNESIKRRYRCSFDPARKRFRPS
jgi:hypothetical protein